MGLVVFTVLERDPHLRHHGLMGGVMAPILLKMGANNLMICQAPLSFYMAPPCCSQLYKSLRLTPPHMVTLPRKTDIETDIETDIRIRPSSNMVPASGFSSCNADTPRPYIMPQLRDLAGQLQLQEGCSARRSGFARRGPHRSWSLTPTDIIGAACVCAPHRHD